MDNNTSTKTAQDLGELFKIIMNTYWTYIESLENFIKQIPDNETEVLNNMLAHMEEVQTSLEHDISVFEKAINSDIEDIQVSVDELKINAIKNKLQN